MSDDEKIYEPIWKIPLEDYEKNIPKPKLLTINGSLTTNLSESEDGFSESCKDFEGESVDDLDIPVFRQSVSHKIEKPINSKVFKSDALPFPKNPCFSEFDDNDKLEYYGPITQIVQKLTTNKKLQYAVLLSKGLILFAKPEHKVSKIQIPLKSMKGIDWIDNINCTNKNDCNKFKLDTPVRSYKFQCSSHENAGKWINHIGKLIFDKQNIAETTESYTLKALVSLENVKGKRIFTIEPKFTVAYYDSEEDFKHGIAMHRIQLRSSGVKRDGTDSNSFTLITSYRKYKLTFETSTLCNEWFQTISVIIQKAISSTCSKNAKSGEDIMIEISKNTSNKLCAECKSSEIEWASINLFITLCSKCSGLHRRLGPNISKIQGIYTDESTWADNNLIKLFRIIGNNNANSFWMAKYSDDKLEIDFKMINNKYSKKKFIEKKELIFEKYKDSMALNEELLDCVKTENILRTMQLFHIGADLNYVSLSSGMKVTDIAQKYNQPLQLTYLNNQCENRIRDWRSDLFEMNEISVDEQTPFQERYLFCSVNHNTKESRIILIWKSCIQILENNFTKKEICKIFFRNICLVREKKLESDQISLIVVVQESEYSTKNSDIDNSINVIEFYGSETDQSNDLKDFKNVIGQNISPNFEPTFSYACIGWVILSTVSEDWKPYLLAIDYKNVANFYNFKKLSHLSLDLDLRKVNKIEELRDNNYENICPFKMYNLASICLISSVIYHIRGDTKESHEELYKAFLQSWNLGDSTLLSNQFLTQNNVPLPVFKMIRYLQIHGTQIEGLFRRVGSIKEAEKIYNQLITDPNSFILTNCDPHDVASALKLFFRRLGDPLLTKQLYEYWIEAVDIQNSEEKFNYFKIIVKNMPQINYQTLRLLIFLLVNIDKNNDITQMNPDNLATSFNTCLLTGSHDEGFNFKNLQILPYLIRNYQDLFDVTQEELEMEKMYNKERMKIKDCPQSEISLLRQIYVQPELESLLKQDINFEKEHGNKNDNFKELLSKQLRIEQSMTSKSLFKKLFKEHVDTKNILIFEDRKVDELHMEHLIYPQENLIKVIQNSEKSDSPKKWIFKFNKYNMELKSKNTLFKCLASLSISSKNKVCVELSKTNQINIWKNEQNTELLVNIPIKDMILFRSCEEGKYIVAFEDRKNQITSSPGLFQLFLFKSRSSYNFINFSSKTDYVDFLHTYDQSKLMELTPSEN